MKLKAEHILIIGLLILLALQTCKNSSSESEDEITTKNFHSETSETKTDTFYIEGEKVNIPVYQIKWLTKNTRDTLFLPSEDVLAKLDTFHASVEDSLLTAQLTVYSETRPFIDFEYKLKTFETTVTNTIKDSTYTEIVKKKSFASLGATLVGSKANFGFAPVVQYNHKSGMDFNIGYDILGKNLHLGFSKRISFKK